MPGQNFQNLPRFQIGSKVGTSVPANPSIARLRVCGEGSGTDESAL
jgi:hypothetical protein